MNPRYIAYCRAHGKTTDEMMAHDYDRWPGGIMCGFILWMSERWAEWKVRQDPARIARARQFGWVLSAQDHAAFDEWLA